MEQFISLTFEEYTNMSTENNTFIPNLNGSRPDGTSQSIRSLVLGPTGVILNFLGLVLLILSKKIKVPLKLALVNQAANDFLFMVIVTLLGLYQSSWQSHYWTCWPIVILLLTTMIMSYINIAFLSIHNFIAVFYPLSCTQILTTPRTVVSILIIWFASVFIIVGSIGIHTVYNQICYPSAIMSRFGVGTVSVVCLLCAGWVSILSLRIYLKVRRSHQVVGISTISSANSRTVSDRVRELSLTTGMSGTQRVSGPENAVLKISSCATLSMSRPQNPTPPVSRTECEEYPTAQQHSPGMKTNDKSTHRRVCSVMQEEIHRAQGGSTLNIAGSSKRQLLSSTALFETKSECTYVKRMSNIDRAASDANIMHTGDISGFYNNNGHGSDPVSSNFTPVTFLSSCSKNTESDKHIHALNKCLHDSVTPLPRDYHLPRIFSQITRSMSSPQLGAREPGRKKGKSLRTLVKKVATDTQNRAFGDLTPAIFNVHHESPERSLNGPKENHRIVEGNAMISDLPTDGPDTDRREEMKCRSGIDTPEKVSTWKQKINRRTHAQPGSKLMYSMSSGKQSGKDLTTRVHCDNNCPHASPVEVKVNSVLDSKMVCCCNEKERPQNEPNENKNMLHITNSADGVKDKNAVRITNSVEGINLFTPAIRKKLRHIPKSTKESNELLQETFAKLNHSSNSNSSRYSVCNDGRYNFQMEETQKPLPIIQEHVSPQRPHCEDSTLSPAERRRVRIRNTLLILTLWCCFLTLPFIVYWFYVAAIMEDRGDFATSNLGILLSSLVICNALTNPFFYAWRFISWAQIYSRLWVFLIRYQTNGWRL